MTNSVNDNDLNKTSTEQNNNDNKPAEDNVDNYGYDKTPPEGEKKPEEGEKDDTGYAKEEDDTGYKKDDKPAEDKTPPEGEKKPEEGEKTPEEITKEEIETALKELPENIDKEKTSKFAIENNMTKEQVEAYVNLVNDENVQLVKDNEAQVLETRKQWKDDLYKDPEFGADSSETFDKNVHEVNQVLKNHMPNMKKNLTDSGKRLPPYIMKDLLGISKILNPKTDLVNGDPSKVETKEKNFLDEMYQ